MILGATKMKAYIRNGGAGPQGGPFHGHELQLTVGMIVKNEEKTLGRCLAALEPLRKAVPSELIVTDTGSTDRTVEIAEKYTGNVLHFDWCDDFAAARNTGLFAAKGEWFLFLDADEWFDDTAELARFFKSGECDRYWTGSFVVRSYTDFRGKDYNDFHACRMFRTYPGIHFQNRVHEDIQVVAPTKVLEHTFVHHYGYVFHSVDERNRKIGRNIAMLVRELKEEPENLKAYSQLAGQYLDTGENEKTVFYAERGLKLAEKQPKTVRSYELELHLFRARFNQRHYGWILERMDRALAGGDVRDLFHLEELWFAQAAAFRLQQYQKVLEYAGKYLDIYADYEAGRLDKTFLIYSTFTHVSPRAKEDCLMTLTRAFLAMEEPEEAVRTFRKLDLSGDSFLSNGSIQLCFDLACQTKDDSLLPDYLRACLAAGGKSGEEGFADFAEMYERTHPADADAIRLALAKADLGAYSGLCTLREAESRGDAGQVRGILDRYEQSKEKLRLFEGDVLYIAMEEGRDLMPLLLKTDADDYPAIVFRAARAHGGFPDVVEKYSGLYSFQNAVGLRFMACATERALLLAAENDERERCLRLFDGYIRVSMRLIRSTYLPEALVQPSLAALPRPVRFACLVNSAFAARSRADGVAYLEGMHAALKEYPAMDRPVQFLLDRFRKEQKEQEQKAKEFAQLAEQVKNNIEALIGRGELVKAGQITAQLAALMPNDEDVHRYQKLTHTEPTMREIASHLPQ